jgi:hypothetical protein
LGQHHYYRGDKGCHFITTRLLIDFDGWIVALATAIPGHMHDVNSAQNLLFFREIIGSLYALADPGYYGCDYVIAGMKRKCIHTDNEREFFKITYREQRKIEHINNFFKKCRPVAKDTVFRHDEALQAGCILISCGMYNKRMLDGDFASQGINIDDIEEGQEYITSSDNRPLLSLANLHQETLHSVVRYFGVNLHVTLKSL